MAMPAVKVMAKAARYSKGDALSIMFVLSLVGWGGVGGGASGGGAQIAPELLLQLGLQPGRADDAGVGQPVAHGGQNLVGVRNEARDEQATVGQLFFNFLAVNEFAAPEIVRRFAINLEDDFGLFEVEPNAVFFRQRLDDGRVGLEGAFARHQQGADFGEAVRLECPGVAGREVPNAALVDQLVGVDRFDPFFSIGFAVTKADRLAALDGLLQLAEAVFEPRQVFVLVSAYLQALQAAVEQVSEQFRAQAWVQALQARHRGKPLHVAGG